MAPRSRPATTSTTNRARCFSGSHSSTEGGIRKPVSRSIGRKLLMREKAGDRRKRISVPGFYPRPIRDVKSDRLLDDDPRLVAQGKGEMADRLTEKRLNNDA